MPYDQSKPQSLADVLSILTSLPADKAPRRQAQIAAVRRIVDFLHRPPSDIPCDIQTLRPQLADLHPAQCGVTAKRLGNIKSELAAALRNAGALPAAEPKPERTPDWVAFLGHMTADHQVWGLARFVDFCCRQGIAPGRVTDDVMAAYRADIEARLLVRDSDKVAKATAQTWNFIVQSAGLSLPTLGYKRAGRYLARPFTDYPKSLQIEIQTYLDRLSHADIFNADGPAKPLRPTSLRNIKAHLAQFLDALVSSGHDPAEFTNLGEVVTAAKMKSGFRAIQARRGTNAVPVGLGNIAGTLTAIARHHLKMPDEHLRPLLAVKKKVTTDPKGMSSKNRERLMQFDDWQNVVRLVSLCTVLMDRANAAPLSRKSALLAMHAAALAILLSCPMRVANLASLDFDRHLRPRLNGTHTIYGIRIDGSEVKNGEPIEVELNGKASRLLHRYVTQFRPQISRARGTALFPRSEDGKPRAPSNLSAELKMLIQRETGLTVHMHLFRHFAAMLYLHERPGDFETVRRLLKHRRLQTTMDFYAPLSNQWAHNRYDEVVLSKFGGRDV